MATRQERAVEADRYHRGPHEPATGGNAGWTHRTVTPLGALRRVLAALWVVVDRLGLVVLFCVGGASLALVAGPSLGALFPLAVTVGSVLGAGVGVWLEYTRRYPPLF